MLWAGMAAVWHAETMDGLLMLHSTVTAYGYDGMGDFVADADGLLQRRPEGEISPWLFAGVQILKASAFDELPTGAFSLNVVYDKLLATGRLYGMVHDGEWFHIGTPEGLDMAETFLQVAYPGEKKR